MITLNGKLNVFHADLDKNKSGKEKGLLRLLTLLNDALLSTMSNQVVI
jgi:hypothetical protein